MSEVLITEHALVRFIERVKGVSLDPYREELRSLVGAKRVWSDTPHQASAEEHLMVMEGDTLITVLPPGARGKKRGPRRFMARYSTIPVAPPGDPK